MKEIKNIDITALPSEWKELYEALKEETDNFENADALIVYDEEIKEFLSQVKKQLPEVIKSEKPKKDLTPKSEPKDSEKPKKKKNDWQNVVKEIMAENDMDYKSALKLYNIRREAEKNKKESINKMIDTLKESGYYDEKELSDARIDPKSYNPTSAEKRERLLPKDAKQSAVTDNDEIKKTGRKFKRLSPTYGKPDGAKLKYYYEYRMNRRDKDAKIRLAEGGGVDNPIDESITANNWWNATLSMNEQKAFIEKYAPFFLSEVQRPRLHGNANHEIINIWKQEGSPVYSEWLEKQYGIGDLTDENLSTKIFKSQSEKASKKADYIYLVDVKENGNSIILYFPFKDSLDIFLNDLRETPIPNTEIISILPVHTGTHDWKEVKENKEAYYEALGTFAIPYELWKDEKEKYAEGGNFEDEYEDEDQISSCAEPTCRKPVYDSSEYCATHKKLDIDSKLKTASNVNLKDEEMNKKTIQLLWDYLQDTALKITKAPKSKSEEDSRDLYFVELQKDASVDEVTERINEIEQVELINGVVVPKLFEVYGVEEKEDKWVLKVYSTLEKYEKGGSFVPYKERLYVGSYPQKGREGMFKGASIIVKKNNHDDKTVTYRELDENDYEIEEPITVSWKDFISYFAPFTTTGSDWIQLAEGGNIEHWQVIEVPKTYADSNNKQGEKGTVWEITDKGDNKIITLKFSDGTFGEYDADIWNENKNQKSSKSSPKRTTIKDSDIIVGAKFKFPNDEIITIKRLFNEPRGGERKEWVEYIRDGIKKESSVYSLRLFLNNWKAEQIESKSKMYHRHSEIKTVKVKIDGKERTFSGEDVLNGANVFAEGGKISEHAKYVSNKNIIEVVLEDGKKIHPKNGYWIDKDALEEKPEPKSPEKQELKFDFNTFTKKGYYGWQSVSEVDNINGYDWKITTMKRNNGKLVTIAQGGKKDNSTKGYSTFMFTVFQDPSITLISTSPSRVTDKVVSEQQDKALELFKEKMYELAGESKPSSKEESNEGSGVEDDFSFLEKLSDKQLEERLDLIRKQQTINGKQYFEAKEKNNSTKTIEEARIRLDNQENAIIKERQKRHDDSSKKVISNLGKYGKDNPRLVKFDIDSLDDYEEQEYQTFRKQTLNKAEALQIIINNVEGDYSQLSSALSEIAMEQDGEEFKFGGTVKGHLNSIKAKYRRNEDNNRHSENVVLLAENFGSDEDLQLAKILLSKHKKENYLSSEDGKKRQDLHQKLISIAENSMKREGVNFYEKGGNIDEVITIYIDNYPYYLKKGGDTTHLYMANSKEGVDIVIPSHIAEYRGLNFYSDVASWLKGGKSPDGNHYTDPRFKKGGNISKSDLSKYIFTYHYPKHNRKPAFEKDYLIDLSKSFPVGGLKEKGYALTTMDGDSTNLVISENKAIETIKKGLFIFEQFDGYFVKITARPIDTDPRFKKGGNLDSEEDKYVVVSKRDGKLMAWNDTPLTRAKAEELADDLKKAKIPSVENASIYIDVFGKTKFAEGGNVEEEISYIERRIDNLEELYEVINESEQPELRKTIDRLKAEKSKLENKKFAKGGNISDLENYAGEIATRTGLTKDAILNFAKANDFSADDLLKIVSGLGRTQLKPIDVSTAITGTKGNTFEKELLDYVKSDKAFKKSDSPKKPEKMYHRHSEIKYVIVKKDGKELKYAGDDVLNGANVFKQGGKITDHAKYISNKNIVDVVLQDGTSVHPKNGYWIDKDAEPIQDKKTIKELESKKNQLLNRLEKAKESLKRANDQETERFSRLGWGSGMRMSKLNVSSTKSDNAKTRIESIESEIESINKEIASQKPINPKSDSVEKVIVNPNTGLKNASKKFLEDITPTSKKYQLLVALLRGDKYPYETIGLDIDDNKEYGQYWRLLKIIESADTKHGINENMSLNEAEKLAIKKANYMFALEK